MTRLLCLVLGLCIGLVLYQQVQINRLAEASLLTSDSIRRLIVIDCHRGNEIRMLRQMPTRVCGDVP